MKEIDETEEKFIRADYPEGASRIRALADFSFSNADTLCQAEHKCRHYHKVWTTYRLIKPHSAVPVGASFFEHSIKSMWTDKTLRILISGAADTALVAMVASICYKHQISAHVILIDRCETVIRQNKMYADMIGLKLETHTANLIGFQCNHVDVIIDHNFAAWLGTGEFQGVANTWKAVLGPSAKILMVCSLKNEDDTRRFVNAQGLFDINSRTEIEAISSVFGSDHNRCVEILKSKILSSVDCYAQMYPFTFSQLTEVLASANLDIECHQYRDLVQNDNQRNFVNDHRKSNVVIGHKIGTSK